WSGGGDWVGGPADPVPLADPLRLAVAAYLAGCRFLPSRAGLGGWRWRRPGGCVLLVQDRFRRCCVLRRRACPRRRSVIWSGASSRRSQGTRLNEAGGQVIRDAIGERVDGGGSPLGLVARPFPSGALAQVGPPRNPS